MGLFDSLLGRTKVEKPTLERLFAMSTAQVTLETELDLHPSKTAAICFKPMSSSLYRESGIHVTAQSMTDDGFGEQILCALFGFEPGNVRFVYNFKRGAFYPFVPQGKHTRDTERELQLQARLENELPIEAELERWYPLWDAPI